MCVCVCVYSALSALNELQDSFGRETKGRRNHRREGCSLRVECRNKDLIALYFIQSFIHLIIVLLNLLYYIYHLVKVCSVPVKYTVMGKHC